ncbi:hypothetical protein JOM56_011815 [Amanita muscaria]
MRFEIVLFISSLVVLAFGANPFPPPSHGDTVRFQGTRGPNRAVVVGSPDKEGKYNLAPFRPSYNVQLKNHPVHRDRIVKAHPDDIASIPNQPPRPKLASAIASGHAKNASPVSGTNGPVFGSKNYRDAAPPMPSNAAGLRHGKGYQSA